MYKKRVIFLIVYISKSKYKIAIIGNVFSYIHVLLNTIEHSTLFIFSLHFFKDLNFNCIIGDVIYQIL